MSEIKLSESEKTFISLVSDMAVIQIAAFLPFLNIPVLKQLFSKAIEKIAEILYIQGKITGIFLKIDIKEQGKLNRYNEATDQLRIVLNRPERTQDEINEAREVYRQRLRDLIAIR